MPKLSQLIDLMAQITGRTGSRETVNVYARNLRLAKMISSGGRGPGGAEMPATDCSTLLCSLLASISPKDAAAAVLQTKSLRVHGYFDFECITPIEEIDGEFLLGLDLEHSFFAMISRIIERERERKNDFGIPFNRIDIEVSVPPHYARIRVWSGQFLFSILYKHSDERENRSQNSREVAPHFEDMHVEKSIGIDTFYALGDFLSGAKQQIDTS